MSTTEPFDEPTEESWELLRLLAREYKGIVLLGGWATWVHNRSAKSHDVDIIVPFEEFERMRGAEQLDHSTHIGGEKWRLSYSQDTHADIYVPFRSRLGQYLELPVENLLPHAEARSGLLVLAREALVAAKMAALLDRPDSLPGRKDRDDITSLLLQSDGFAWEKIVDVLSPPKAPSAARLQLALTALDLVAETQGIRPDDRQRLREALVEGRAMIQPALAAMPEHLLRPPGPGNLQL